MTDHRLGVSKFGMDRMLLGSTTIMRWPRKSAAPVMVIVMLRSTVLGMRRRCRCQSGGAALAVSK